MHVHFLLDSHLPVVIPAQAGIQLDSSNLMSKLDPRLRGDDGLTILTGYKS